MSISPIASGVATGLRALDRNQKKRAKNQQELATGEKKDPFVQMQTQQLRSGLLDVQREGRASARETEQNNQRELAEAQEARALAIEAANDTLTSDEREVLSQRYQQVTSNSSTLSATQVDTTDNAGQAIAAADEAMAQALEEVSQDAAAALQEEIQQQTNDHLEIALSEAKSQKSDTDYAAATAEASQAAVMAAMQIKVIMAGLKTDKTQTLSIMA